MILNREQTKKLILENSLVSDYIDLENIMEIIKRRMFK